MLSEHTYTTAEQYAAQNKISVPAVHVALKRKGFVGMSAQMELTEDMLAVLNARRPRSITKVHALTPASKEKPAFHENEARLMTKSPAAVVKTTSGFNLPKPSFWEKFRDGAFNSLAVLIVVAHAMLIWFDCWDLWRAPGAIGGGIAFFVVCLALIISTDPSKQRTSESAMWFVLVVDVGAWFVHNPTFLRYANADQTLTAWICGAICTFSFMALYLFRDSKLS